jgi:hypothetical protein
MALHSELPGTIPHALEWRPMQMYDVWRAGDVRRPAGRLERKDSLEAWFETDVPTLCGGEGFFKMTMSF